ncbi:hypothetical protein BDZ89DRAFT_1058265 [Hymenopellis radicata]|nr:hypothetical protein BDZ89DRAFT_1058265 [Hymenopellis radicata]
MSSLDDNIFASVTMTTRLDNDHSRRGDTPHYKHPLLQQSRLLGPRPRVPTSVPPTMREYQCRPGRLNKTKQDDPTTMAMTRAHDDADNVMPRNDAAERGPSSASLRPRTRLYDQGRGSTTKDEALRPRTRLYDQRRGSLSDHHQSSSLNSSIGQSLCKSCQDRRHFLVVDLGNRRNPMPRCDSGCALRESR